MVRAFEAAFGGDTGVAQGVRHGFFASVDGAPAEGYRAPRAAPALATPVTLGRAPSTVRPGPTAVVTGTYGAMVLGPLLERAGLADVRVVTVANDFFGGNIGVAGLLTGTDLARVLATEPEGHRYLLPDACLSEGRFLDGLTLADLPRPVEVVPTDGRSLRAVLEGRPVPAVLEGRPVPAVLEGRPVAAGCGGGTP